MGNRGQTRPWLVNILNIGISECLESLRTPGRETEHLILVGKEEGCREEESGTIEGERRQNCGREEKAEGHRG